MRISTQAFFERSAAGMSSLQQQLFNTQQKIAAGRKFLAPSADPVAAARALGVAQSMAESSQYASTRGRTVQMLSMEDSALQNAAGILQDVKSLVVQAGNGALSDADRSTIATALEGDFSQLLGVANSDDGNGQYLFAGFRSDSVPFVQQASGTVAYGGDTGQRMMQVDVARQMAATDDGHAVFQSVQGSAAPVPAAAAGNTGTGVFGSVNVSDGKNYTITFGAGGTYTVDDGSGPQNLVPFTPGGTVNFGGLTMRIDGAPAAGDVFTVTQAAAPAAQPDVFAAMRDLINVLRAPVAGAAAQAKLANALSTANVRVTNALDNVVTVRASVGSRLSELDALGASGDARSAVDQKYLSELRDLDYASAITEFAQRQTNLQATQQTFARLQNIALFNYL